MKNYTSIGHPHPIKDAGAKVTGQFQYVADMSFPNMLYAKVLFSEIAHGEVLEIDTTEAEKVEGVVAIAHCFNTSSKRFNSSLRFYDHKLIENEVVFSKHVRFVGDRIGAVAAESIEAAEEAIKKIKVTYKEFPAVFDVEEAAKEDAISIHEGGNLLARFEAVGGDIDQGFKDADFTFEQTFKTPMIHHGAIEHYSAIANYDFNGKLTVYSANQNTFQFRTILASIFDLPLHKVRMVCPGIGGSFGGKLEMNVEHIVSALSIMTRRPVKLEYNRKESMISTRTRNGSVVTMKTGVKKSGEIVAQDIFMLTNTGAYASSGVNVMAALHHKIFKVYKTKNMRFIGHPVYTNLPVAGAMRGYGSPQIFAAQQMHMQKIATEIGMDMVEFQLLNAIDVDGVDVRFNSLIGNPRLKDCIVKGSTLMDWQNKNPYETDTHYIGYGMAVGAHGNGVFGAHRDFITLTLTMNEDASLTLQTGVHEMGNGSETMQTQMIAEVLEVPASTVETFAADTDAVPWNLGDYASRGVFVEGGGALKVAEKMRKYLLEIATEYFNDPAVAYTNGVFTSNNNKASLSEIVQFVHREKQEDVCITESYQNPAGRTSYGAHFCKVQINKKTMKIDVTDYVAVHDVGQIINPLGLEGQLEGGIQMGIGYALSEELKFNEKGVLENSSLGKYRMIRATQMPKLQTAFIEEYEPDGPFGGKSIGECATNPVAPAVANAVANALNITVTELPIQLTK